MTTRQLALTSAEKTRLTKHEETIKQGLESFVDVGRALLTIRDERLYRELDNTFEGYCKNRWGFSRQRAHQIIDAAKVVRGVSTIVDTPPANEGQARVLAGLPDEQTQATVWEKAVATAPKDKHGGPRLTAAHVSRVARSFTPQARGHGTPQVAEIDQTEPGGYERHEALEPLAKMDAIFSKLMEHYTMIEKILRTSDPIVQEIHAGLDSAYRAMGKLRTKLKRAG